MKWKFRIEILTPVILTGLVNLVLNMRKKIFIRKNTKRYNGNNNTVIKLVLRLSIYVIYLIISYVQLHRQRFEIVFRLF